MEIRGSYDQRGCEQAITPIEANEGFGGGKLIFEATKEKTCANVQNFKNQKDGTHGKTHGNESGSTPVVNAVTGEFEKQKNQQADGQSDSVNLRFRHA